MACYEIRVQGRLTARWTNRFDGLALRPEADGTTLISGVVADQAALHAVLRALGDLGLPLVAVTEVLPDPVAMHLKDDTTTQGD
jgi:hypothetical protein